MREQQSSMFNIFRSEIEALRSSKHQLSVSTQTPHAAHFADVSAGSSLARTAAEEMESLLIAACAVKV